MDDPLPDDVYHVEPRCHAVVGMSPAVAQNPAHAVVAVPQQFDAHAVIPLDQLKQECLKKLLYL